MGDLINAASPYRGVARGLRPRQEAIAPVGLHRPLAIVCKWSSASWEAWAGRLSLPFALVGGLWMLWGMGFNLSVAVAVGFIALAGVAAETGVVMLIYLDHTLGRRHEVAAREGRALTAGDLDAAIMEGAVERVRPKMTTVVAIMAGLLPINGARGRDRKSCSASPSR